MGIPGLDQVLKGGLPRDHVYLIEGAPGAGKTTLALQFAMEGVRTGETVLYIALSETRAELDVIAASHGWNLEKLSIEELTPVEAAIRPGEEYTIFHPDDVELSATIDSILARVKEVNPTRIVIDSMAELRLLSPDPVKYRRQVLALKQYFTHQRLTVLLLDDSTSKQADHQMHSIVHGVIVLERLAREYGKSRRRLEITKLRGASYTEGFHDYLIAEGGLVVFPRLISDHHDEPGTREIVSSNVTGLDDLLGGGLDRGTATLLIGPSGTGKTTLCLKYASAAIGRTESAKIYSFDESSVSLQKRGDQLGMDISRHQREGKIRIDQINPAELSPGEFAFRVRKDVEQGTQVVMIDSLNGYLTAMPQETYLNLQMHELLGFLSERGVVTILVLAQQGIFGDAETHINLSYLADSIVLLRFFEAAGQVRRAISVVKKRSSRHEQTIREFTIGGPDAIEIGGPLSNFQGVLSGSPRFTGDPSVLQ